MQSYPITTVKKILIVDDQPSSVEPVKMMFELEGYQPKITKSHVGIFHEIEEFNPDLILLDILLQGTDGRYVCDLLKSTQRTKHIPIILISGGVDLAAVLAENTSANGFLCKPFDFDDSMNLVRSLLN